ncbi:MAG: ABC transporter ATP-binding protein [Dehalococcoidia bacterium]|nr:ABC transporter ATP-binding protein [Dehalococcoidia bacterium]MCB9491424.1 ABC transporter ATP-binding protein [Dehalococcoidia bacterium]
MSFYEEEELIGKVYDRRIAGRLLSYLRPYRTQVVISVLLMLVVAGLELVPTLLVKYAIDEQITPGRTDQLGKVALLFLGTLLLGFMMRFVQMYLTWWVGQRFMVDLRMQLFSHIQHLSVSYFDRNPVGRLVTRLTGDIQQIEMVISQGIIQILTNLLMVTAIVVALYVLNWWLALIMTVFVVPLIFLVRLFAAAQRQAFRDQRMWMARINAYLNELITGVAIIQLFNRQRRNMEYFDQRNSGALEANLRVLFWYAVFEPTVVLFNAVTITAIIWVGGGASLDGAVSIGTLVAFISFMQRFFWPIRELSERYTMIQGAMASAERIFGVLDAPEEVVDSEGARPLAGVRGDIRFDHVWFAYEPENWVLKDVDFTIPAGQKVAIVGATGAGKSTTMALLSRFYDVQRGAILVDGEPIRDLPQRWLRRHVGVMLQDPWIVSDSVEENIRLRDTSISDEQVRAAAEAVGASKFIERLPDGYRTVLAERGANLSTGQKQLIALARVAAFNPEIVLVMDEATASIDPETEETIQSGLDRVMAGRTALIIAHRLNTIRAVDRIIVLHLGEVVEDGSHDELIAQGGIYARLYELQYQVQAGV